jgi:exodeoxyribonuclease-5
LTKAQCWTSASSFDGIKESRKLTLSRVHRQAEDNPILDLAHALGDDSFGFEQFEKLVHQMAAKDDRVTVSPRVRSDLMARSPVLVWRNATRIRLIQAFRTAYGAPVDLLLPGEPLICDGIELPVKHRKKRIDLEARGLIKGAQVVYMGEGRKVGFSRLHVLGAPDPQVSAATIIKIEAPGEEEPFIPSAARMGAVFVHGAACTIHKAQGSQWSDVQVFAPDLYAAARAGRTEAGIPLWKRLAYVAITRAEHRLHWVTRYMLAKPEAPLTLDDLKALPAPDLTLASPEDAGDMFGQ